MTKKLIYILCFWIASANQLLAQDLSVASIFGDQMVLQQGIKTPLWGVATPNEEVKISFNGKTISTKVNADGKWMVHLPVMKAGGPFEMSISSPNSTLTLKDILIGEVWLASGQSNMQFGLGGAINSEEEIAAANYPNIRFFQVGLNISSKPLDKVRGSWRICKPENVRYFSAVAYFFAKELYQNQKIPVGIISSSWGGTPIEPFISGESLINQVGYKDSVEKYQKLQEDWELLYNNYLKATVDARTANQKAPAIIPQKNYPTSLYNAMIAPLLPYGIKGVIWYQGESNAGRVSQAIQYRTLFPLLINDWRNKWDNPKMPFLFVQLANFKVRDEQPVSADPWALLREAQTMTLKLPYTGMAVAIDIGEGKDIHPKNKQDVGKRLYLAASHVAYNKPVVYSGPVYDKMMINRDKVELSFKIIGKGLTSNDKPLTAFEIAGADKKFYWADAEIVGDKIVLSNKNVVNPVAVRYAWSTNPAVSLYNKDGLPASPFRTDDW